MTAFGIQIGWLALRVTVVALLARVLLVWTGRRAGRSNVAVLASVLMMLLALTAVAMCPLPESWRLASLASAEAVSAASIADSSDHVPSDVEPVSEGLAFSQVWV